MCKTAGDPDGTEGNGRDCVAHCLICMCVRVGGCPVKAMSESKWQCRPSTASYPDFKKQTTDKFLYEIFQFFKLFLMN
jgi:hypothetical protein